jgi:GNAT superfamily N-acetyltransferase
MTVNFEHLFFMKAPLSLSLRSEIAVFRELGEVLPRDDYVVLRSPRNQTYRWGNRIHWLSPFEERRLKEQKAIFQQHFRDLPLVRHFTISWDDSAAQPIDLARLEQLGFSPDPSVTLLLKEIAKPHHFNSQIVCRPLNSTMEWDRAFTQQIQVRSKNYSAEDYQSYLRPKFDAYRRLPSHSTGEWYGAFLADQLAGNLGVIWDQEIVRFQLVATDPAYQRQGICSTLLWHACHDLRRRFPTLPCVIMADPDYHAISIYKEIGFEMCERQVIAVKAF